MPEARFKELFFSRSPRLKTPDDLVSVITLGLLGPEYMAGALTKGRSRRGAAEKPETLGVPYDANAEEKRVSDQ